MGKMREERGVPKRMLGHTPIHGMLHVHAQERVCLVLPQLRESSETIALTEPSAFRDNRYT